ncbi:MAG TPA: Xaa-Pro peptidase family protein [Solirubrobacteraceae bacterium]|nr:Xaa-Pro peptidase family protein [Solirubrobacteraceae bacterium]
MQRLSEALPDAEVDLLLVSNLVNVRYLTGFTGTSGLVLIGPDLRLFVTDFRYTEQAHDEVPAEFVPVTAAGELLDAVLDRLPDGALRLGYEAETMTVEGCRQARELLPERVELVATTGLVERLRRVKDEREIELIAAAQKIADAALEALLIGGLEGRTERELALTLEHDLRLRGADGPSFGTIVAAGAHGALPHAAPRDVPLGRGELVVVDWGAVYRGYASDCTRTFAIGEPGPEAREVYELVLGAQQAGLEAIRAGGDGREIDRVVRDIIHGAGHADHFGHGLGHGVGLEVHEAPWLSFRGQDILEAGNVVTVEPGVYLPGRFGIRIEDLVVVTDDGCRILTTLPKALRMVE